jgi:hypothetical protein
MNFISQPCEVCNEDAFFDPPDPDGSYVLECTRCGTKYSSVWCDKCGMGGDFVEKPDTNPRHWTCPGCKTRYSLSARVLFHPIPLVPKSLLSPEDQAKVTVPKPRFLSAFDPIFTGIGKLRPLFSFAFFTLFVFTLITHLISIAVGQSLVICPQFFFIASLLALFAAVPAERFSIKEGRWKKGFGSVPRVAKIILLAISLYGIAIYVYGLTISHGQRLSELPMDQRLAADLNTTLCMQAFWMLLLLAGSLVLWFDRDQEVILTNPS